MAAKLPLRLFRVDCSVETDMDFYEKAQAYVVARTRTEAKDALRKYAKRTYVGEGIRVANAPALEVDISKLGVGLLAIDHLED